LYILYFFAIVVQMTKRSHLGTFELTVMLALIRLGENAYGIPIAHEIEVKGGREVSLGSIYATLQRLEAKGLVSSKLGEPTPERGGRAKKYFSVTAKGVREVRETQRALKELWHGLRQLEGRRV
jgi:PadR family transcriptional regulator, regulatory protein PadR